MSSISWSYLLPFLPVTVPRTAASQTCQNIVATTSQKWVAGMLVQRCKEVTEQGGALCKAAEGRPWLSETSLLSTPQLLLWNLCLKRDILMWRPLIQRFQWEMFRWHLSYKLRVRKNLPAVLLDFVHFHKDPHHDKGFRKCHLGQAASGYQTDPSEDNTWRRITPIGKYSLARFSFLPETTSRKNSWLIHHLYSTTRVKRLLNTAVTHSWT